MRIFSRQEWNASCVCARVCVHIADPNLAPNPWTDDFHGIRVMHYLASNKKCFERSLLHSRSNSRDKRSALSYAFFSYSFKRTFFFACWRINSVNAVDIVTAVLNRSSVMRGVHWHILRDNLSQSISRTPTLTCRESKKRNARVFASNTNEERRCCQTPKTSKSQK